MTDKDYVCPECGGPLLRDAWAEWCPETQEMVLVDVFDNWYCAPCDGTLKSPKEVAYDTSRLQTKG